MEKKSNIDDANSLLLPDIALTLYNVTLCWNSDTTVRLEAKRAHHNYPSSIMILHVVVKYQESWFSYNCSCVFGVNADSSISLPSNLCYTRVSLFCETHFLDRAIYISLGSAAAVILGDCLHDFTYQVGHKAVSICAAYINYTVPSVGSQSNKNS